MVMGHNTGDARYILTGNSIEDLEKGLAEMKRQIAAGITFSVCYGGDKSEFEKECDNDCNDCEYDIIDSYGNYDSEYECEEDDDWKVCEEEGCDDCPLMDEDEDEEEENEVKEEVDKNEVAEAIAQGIVAAIKDFFEM